MGLPAGDYPDEDGGTSLVNAQAFVNGAAVTLSNNAALTQSDAPASGLTIAQQDQTAYAVSGAGALMAASIGSDGYADGNKNPDSDNFNGGDGGDGGTVSLSHTGTLSVTARGALGPSGNSPIPSFLNGIGAFSIGGDGVAIKAHDRDWAGDGGDGGAIDVSVSGSGSRRALAPWAIYARSRPAASTPPTRALRAR